MKYRKAINEAEIKKQWMPIISEATGLSYNNKAEREKMEWMSVYSHFHMMNESANATPTNVPGMGAISFPLSNGTQQGFASQQVGSGDTPYTLLPFAMQVAAQTVGLDLVPVVPMDSAFGILHYVDGIYAGGKMDTLETPEMIKVPVKQAAEDAMVATPPAIMSNVTITNGTVVLTGKFVGRSRIDGYPIVKVNSVVDGTTPKTISDAVALNANIAISGSFTDGVGQAGEQGVLGKAEFVKALEDHVSGFSGKMFLTENAADVNSPYSREEGENTNSRSLGIKFYTKEVRALTWQADIAVTREQIQDSRALGFDLMQQAQALLANETTQALNKNILERIFALGATNHSQIYYTTGVHFNINFDDDTVGNKTFNLGLGQNGVPVSLTVPATKAPAAKPTTLTGGETLLTAQRRILDQILAAGNMIAVRGRRGSANCAVTNAQVATLLQSISGFQAAPLQNTINQMNGALHMLGSISGIMVYVDPNMGWEDTRIAIFRKGDGATPGLIFMPYLLAESVDTIAESTMAPKIQVKSRYALPEAGHHPQAYYVTLKINVIGSLLQ